MSTTLHRTWESTFSAFFLRKITAYSSMKHVHTFGYLGMGSVTSSKAALNCQWVDNPLCFSPALLVLGLSPHFLYYLEEDLPLPPASYSWPMKRPSTISHVGYSFDYRWEDRPWGDGEKQIEEDGYG